MASSKFGRVTLTLLCRASAGGPGALLRCPDSLMSAVSLPCFLLAGRGPSRQRSAWVADCPQEPHRQRLLYRRTKQLVWKWVCAGRKKHRLPGERRSEPRVWPGRPRQSHVSVARPSLTVSMSKTDWFSSSALALRLCQTLSGVREAPGGPRQNRHPALLGHCPRRRNRPQRSGCSLLP